MTTDLCHPHGVMECWNNGMMGSKSRKNRFPILLNPSLQYSITPILPPGRRPYRPESNWGEAPKFEDRKV